MGKLQEKDGAIVALNIKLIKGEKTYQKKEEKRTVDMA